MNYKALMESLFHLWAAMIISGVLALVTTFIGLWIFAVLWSPDTHDDLAYGNNE
jgi:hypothetical protein